jgi:SPASM domain peptide maturase of grasp-with-spasm system
MTNNILNSRFYLYPSIVIVEGKNNDAIYDLQRVKYYIIPKTLTTVIEIASRTKIKDIQKMFNGQESILKSYYYFCKKNDLGIFSEAKSPFIEISTEFRNPKKILTAILDYNKNSDYDINQCIYELNSLKCENLELRFYDKISYSNLASILLNAIDSTLKNIEIVIPYCPDFKDNSCVKNLKRINPRVNKIIIHSSPSFSIQDTKEFSIIFSTEVLNDESNCGVTNNWYYFPNTYLYIMSKNVNNCLYGKISVDKNGNIKNCPSLQESFGNIATTTFRQALKNKAFYKYWFINKDKIMVCSECERRYMCHDCRAYICDKNNIYSKPLKCQYNP